MSLSRITEYCNKESSDKILLIGDIMLDVYMFGKTNRLSPEAPVPVVTDIIEREMLGGCGNVARNLKAFGANFEIISLIGNDAAGDMVIKHLNQLEISSKHIIRSSDRVTTEKRRIISQNQQLIRIDNECTDQISSQIEDKLLNIFTSIIDSIDIVMLSDYAKGMLSEKVCKKIIKACSKRNIRVLVDPKFELTKYEGSYLIKPNKFEAQALVESVDFTNKDDIKQNLLNFKFEKYPYEKIIITLGELGIFIGGKNEKSLVIDGINVGAFDVSGAGDTVFASIGYCLSKGLSVLDSVIFANSAASIVIQKFGSETTTIENVLKQLNGI